MYGAIEYPEGSGNYWMSGNYASGARADYNNAAATQTAAWYGAGDDAWPGNTAGRSIVANRIPALKQQFGTNSAIFIGDSGMYSEANIERLEEFGFDYLRCLGIFMMVGCDPDPVDPTSYTLTMQVDGEGTVDPSEGSHAINDGTVVHL